jgi:hypothetical protein
MLAIEWDQLEWGTVPQYFTGLALIGGLFGFVWQIIQKRKEEMEALAVQAASIKVSLSPPERLGGGTSRSSLGFEVENKGSVPIRDLKYELRYVGNRPVAEIYRKLTGRESTLVPSGRYAEGRTSLLISPDEWDTTGEDFSCDKNDFTWIVSFTNRDGSRWEITDHSSPAKVHK